MRPLMSLSRTATRCLLRPHPAIAASCRAPLRLRAAAGGTRGLCSSASPPKFSLLEWCAANPIKLGVGVATIKTQAADLLTQTALEGKRWSDIDWKRNGLFTVFGFAYQGCFQYYLYVTLFSRWFAGAARFANQPFAAKLTDTAGQVDVLKQVLFDTMVHPLWFFPMYYTLKEALTGSPNAFEAEHFDWGKGITKYAWPALIAQCPAPNAH